MTVKQERKGNEITLYVEGRVDTITAPELQKAILAAFQGTGNLLLDLGEVQYISSAGLRALLIGEKTANSKRGSMQLIHVPEAVLSVLNVTGFAKILKIR